MSYDKNKPLNKAGIQACRALMNRMVLDRARMEMWEEEGGAPYMEKRYPSTFLQQLACHNPDSEWFGYTFEPMTLRTLNEEAYKAGLLPRGLHNNLDEKFGFAQYVYLLLTMPSAFEYWSVYENCPNLVEGVAVAFKFKMGDYIMGHTGVLKIENLYRELGDIGGSLYDPTEKGRCMFDVGVTSQQLSGITTDLSRHLTLVCKEISGELYADKLLVGDPICREDISLPWSDERCNARSMSLTKARSLGYEYVQLSKAGVWQSEIRKDPTY